MRRDRAGGEDDYRTRDARMSALLNARTDGAATATNSTTTTHHTSTISHSSSSKTIRTTTEREQIHHTHPVPSGRHGDAVYPDFATPTGSQTFSHTLPTPTITAALADDSSSNDNYNEKENNDKFASFASSSSPFHCKRCLKSQTHTETVLTVGDAMDAVSQQCVLRGLTNSALWLDQLALDARPEVLSERLTAICPLAQSVQQDGCLTHTPMQRMPQEHGNSGYTHVGCCCCCCCYCTPPPPPPPPSSFAASSSHRDNNESSTMTRHAVNQRSDDGGGGGGGGGVGVQESVESCDVAQWQLQRLRRHHRVALGLFVRGEYQRCHFLLNNVLRECEEAAETEESRQQQQQQPSHQSHCAEMSKSCGAHSSSRNNNDTSINNSGNRSDPVCHERMTCNKLASSSYFSESSCASAAVAAPTKNAVTPTRRQKENLNLASTHFVDSMSTTTANRTGAITSSAIAASVAVAAPTMGTTTSGAATAGTMSARCRYDVDLPGNQKSNQSSQGCHTQAVPGIANAQSTQSTEPNDFPPPPPEQQQHDEGEQAAQQRLCVSPRHRLPAVFQFLSLYALYMDGQRVKNTSANPQRTMNPHLRVLRALLIEALDKCARTPPYCSSCVALTPSPRARCRAAPHKGGGMAAMHNAEPPTAKKQQHPEQSEQPQSHLTHTVSSPSNRTTDSPRTQDPYLCWLMGVVLRDLSMRQESASYLLASVRANPLLWCAWDDLAVLVTRESQLVELAVMLDTVTPRFLWELFRAHVMAALQLTPRTRPFHALHGVRPSDAYCPPSCQDNPADTSRTSYAHTNRPPCERRASERGTPNRCRAAERASPCMTPTRRRCTPNASLWCAPSRSQPAEDSRLAGSECESAHGDNSATVSLGERGGDAVAVESAAAASAATCATALRVQEGEVSALKRPTDRFLHHTMHPALGRSVHPNTNKAQDGDGSSCNTPMCHGHADDDDDDDDDGHAACHGGGGGRGGHDGPHRCGDDAVHLERPTAAISPTGPLTNAWHLLLILFPNNLFVQIKLAGYYYHQRKELARAQRLYEHIQRVDPHCVDCLPDYSNILFMQRDYLALSSLAQHAYHIDALGAEANFVVGNYYVLLGQHERSVLHFRRATSIDPNFVAAWTLLGHGYVEMRNTSAAIEAYRTAVELDQRDYRGWYNLGQIFELLQSYHHALYYYWYTTSLRPRDPRMWTAVGNCLAHDGRMEESVRCLERAAMYEPVGSMVYPDLVKRICLFHVKQDNMARACVYFTKLIHSPASSEEDRLFALPFVIEHHMREAQRYITGPTRAGERRACPHSSDLSDLSDVAPHVDSFTDGEAHALGCRERRDKAARTRAQTERQHEPHGPPHDVEAESCGSTTHAAHSTVADRTATRRAEGEEKAMLAMHRAMSHVAQAEWMLEVLAELTRAANLLSSSAEEEEEEEEEEESDGKEALDVHTDAGGSAHDKTHLRRRVNNSRSIGMSSLDNRINTRNRTHSDTDVKSDIDAPQSASADAMAPRRAAASRSARSLRDEMANEPIVAPRPASRVARDVAAQPPPPPPPVSAALPSVQCDLSSPGAPASSAVRSLEILRSSGPRPRAAAPRVRLHNSPQSSRTSHGDSSATAHSRRRSSSSRRSNMCTRGYDDASADSNTHARTTITCRAYVGASAYAVATTPTRRTGAGRATSRRDDAPPHSTHSHFPRSKPHDGDSNDTADDDGADSTNTNRKDDSRNDCGASMHASRHRWPTRARRESEYSDRRGRKTGDTSPTSNESHGHDDMTAGSGDQGGMPRRVRRGEACPFESEGYHEVRNFMRRMRQEADRVRAHYTRVCVKQM